MSSVLLGVVLVRALALDIVLVVHILRRLLCLMLSPFAIIGVHALGLGEFVDFSTDKAGKELLGEGMRDGLACVAFRY